MGACVAFLWYNAFPLKYSWNTESLALGGIIATFAIAIRKTLDSVLCGIFLIENLSVVIQVGWFRHQKEIRRRPSGVPHGAPATTTRSRTCLNPKSLLVLIVGILLAVITIVTLKKSVDPLEPRTSQNPSSSSAPAKAAWSALLARPLGCACVCERR